LDSNLKQNVEVRFLEAFIHFKDAQINKSIQILNDILKKDPYHVPSITLLAQALVQSEKNPIPLLMSLYKKLPSSEVIAILLAVELAKRNQKERSIELLIETYQLNKTADLAYNLAVLYANTRQYELAQRYLSDAIRLSPITGATFSDNDVANLFKIIYNK
jgi:tetratricopeptide (TPR) repeat protein